MPVPLRPGPFTAAQLAVIRLSAEGLDTDQIAMRLQIGRSAVLDRFTRARLATGLHDRAALVHLAWCHGQLGDRPQLLATIARLREELRDVLLQSRAVA